MKHSAKLIVLSGPIASGKTTIANRYLADNPLALRVSDDEIIVMLGHWLEHEDEARQYVATLAKGMIETHLKTGHDVILPKLVLSAKDLTRLEEIAARSNAEFYEFALTVPKQAAIEMALKRGMWGEGVDAITEKDIPLLEEFYDRMTAAHAARPSMHFIEAPRGEVEATYEQMKSFLV